MNRLVGHGWLLVAAAAGACASLELIALGLPRAQLRSAVFVTSPVPSPSPSPIAPAPPAPRDQAPLEHEQLIRALQRELQRVGCYSGEITGIWGPQSRQAMNLFTDRIKVRLPTQTPDHMLLKLVREQQRPVCSSADVPPAKKPLLERTSAPVEPRLIAPPAEARRPPPRRQPNAETATTEPAPSRTGAMLPRSGVYSAPPPRKAREADQQPPQFVRSLMQGVASALTALPLP